MIEELTPYLIGWRGYFGFCQTPRVLTNLEAWIRRRLRMYLWRQWQNGHNRFKELCRRAALLNLKQCCVDVRAFEIRILASSIEKQFVLDAFMQI